MARRLCGVDTWATRDAVFVCLLAVSAAGFYVSPWLPVYGVFFLVLAVLSFLRLRLALALVPGFAPFVMEPKYIGHLTFAPTELLIGLDVAIALLLIVLRRPSGPRRPKVLTSPFLMPACVFVVAITISTVAAPDRHLALHAYRERVLDPLAYFALVLLFVRSRTDWYWILGSVVAGGVASGAIGLGQFALQRDLSTVNGTGIRRVESLYGSPDNLGLLFDRVIPMWFVIAMAAQWRRPLKLLLWAIGFFLVVPLILTYSIGAWIAIAVVCTGAGALLRPWAKWVVLAAVVVACAGVGVKFRSVEHAFRSGHSNSTQARLDVWRSSFQMVRDRPVLGIGPDNFQRLYAPTLAQDKYNHLCPPGLGYMQPGAGSEPCLSHPHDEFLDFWLSAGILGLISYLWLFYVFWAEGLRLWRGPTGPWARTLALAVMAGMLASMIHGLIDNSYFLADLSLFFWLFCAAVSWLRDEAVLPEAVVPPPNPASWYEGARRIRSPGEAE
jgi:putative inorganic carbon (HCO3(-)) transporter